MNKHDIDKAYVSPYDQFLFEFDRTHQKSESQQKEIDKHARIALLRDVKQTATEVELWEEF